MKTMDKGKIMLISRLLHQHNLVLFSRVVLNYRQFSDCKDLCIQILTSFSFNIYHQLYRSELRELMIKFEFPTKLDELYQVISLQQVKQQLQTMVRMDDMNFSISNYRFSMQKSKYGYVRCRYKTCSAHLCYRLSQNNKFQLIKFSNRHQHILSQSKSYKFKAVSDYIQSLPSPASVSSLKSILCSQFSISSKQLYYIVSKLKGQPLKTPEMIADLESKGYELFVSSQQSQGLPPQILLITNSEMRNAFKDFGDIVSFDLTFNLVKNIHPSNSRWKVGCFLGTSSTRRIIPFAIVSTLYETQQVYTQIFRTFFKAMNGEPKVLVTDQERAIHSAATYLKSQGQFNGLHLYDSYHILHNVRKKLKDKGHIKFFALLLHAKNKPQFQRLLSYTYKQLHHEELPILQKFIQRSQLYCFSQIRRVFFGFTSSSSPNECFHSCIKRIQPTQKAYSITIRNLVDCAASFLNQRNKFSLSSIAYQQIFMLPELKAIRLTLSKPLMVKLIEQLARCIKLEAIQGHKQSIILVKEYNHFFKVQKDQQLWHCQCEYQQKTHLLCRHQLKVLLQTNSSILSNLSSRWKQKPEDSQNNHHFPHISAGREKKSSRFKRY